MNPVDICNIALDNIGSRFSITSLNPPGPPNNPNAPIVARQYYLRVSSLFRAAHWGFARKQVQLSVLAAAAGTPENPTGTTLPIPPVPWQYEYAYPSDCIKARFILPNPPNSGNGVNPPVFGGGVLATPQWFPWGAGFRFQIGVDTTNLQMTGGTGGDFSSDFGPDFSTVTPVQSPSGSNQIKVILTDLEYANLVYTANIPNPDLWDPEFQNAAAASLGAWLVNPLNRSAEIQKEQIQIATSIIQAARIADANEGTESTDHMPDWMAVRGFTGFGELNGVSSYYGWDGMAFPGGMIF